MKWLPLLLAVTLTGCAATGVRMTVGEALLVSEAGATGINHAAIASAQAGLHGEAAAKVKVGVDATNIAVSAAHSAYLASGAQQAALAQHALDTIANTQQALKDAPH